MYKSIDDNKGKETEGEDQLIIRDVTGAMRSVIGISGRAYFLIDLSEPIEIVELSTNRQRGICRWLE